jgi:hypothetical protein
MDYESTLQRQPMRLVESISVCQAETAWKGLFALYMWKWNETIGPIVNLFGRAGTWVIWTLMDLGS